MSDNYRQIGSYDGLRRAAGDTTAQEYTELEQQLHFLLREAREPEHADENLNGLIDKLKEKLASLEKVNA